MPSDHSSPQNQGESIQLRSINVDVFRLILAWLPRKDLLTISLASRLTREEAIKEMLMRPVRILRISKLRLFFGFLLAGDSTRPSYLRQLSLVHIDGSLSPEDIEAFLRVFALCTNLNKLVLQWCDVLILNSSIPPAISALPSLKRFSAGMYRDDNQLQWTLLRMVVGMKKSLRTLHLPLITEALLKDDIFASLAATHNQIESLTMQLSAFLPIGVLFPSVRTLHLIFEDGLPALHELYDSFPNIRELSLDSYTSLRDEPPHVNANIAALQPANAWRSLDLLRASTHVICTLGITCLVRSLDLSFYDHGHHLQIAETIARLRPRKLATSLHCAPNWDAPHAEPPLLLYEAGKAGVKHIFVRMSYSKSHEPGLQDIIRTIQPLLQGSRVELFHLAISGFFSSDDPEEIVNPPIVLDRGLPNADATPRIDVDAVAQSAADMAPHIRMVAITVVFLGHIVWRVDKSSGETVVSKLGAFEGAQAMELEAQRCLED
ncbi:hypothetical protein C2E23DRAFT_887581 [Lenzites betulinus]|nr:hypothetical protein C2E23DRAFT_887581 [Lenzites betulinus]